MRKLTAPCCASALIRLRHCLFYSPATSTASGPTKTAHISEARGYLKQGCASPSKNAKKCRHARNSLTPPTHTRTHATSQDVSVTRPLYAKRTLHLSYRHDDSRQHPRPIEATLLPVLNGVPREGEASFLLRPPDEVSQGRPASSSARLLQSLRKPALRRKALAAGPGPARLRA